MTVINTNISATLAANAIKRNDREMTTAMERLSTGKRVNSAADDAAGLAIGSKFSNQIAGLNQAARNANDGISMVQTAEGAFVEIGDMLQRMRQLAVQAASETYTSTDREALDLEFQALSDEVNSIISNTQWNLRLSKKELWPSQMAVPSEKSPLENYEKSEFPILLQRNRP